jgi:hypothetical protein
MYLLVKAFYKTKFGSSPWPFQSTTLVFFGELLERQIIIVFLLFI